MPRINRPAIDADRVVVAAMFEALLSALVAMRAQRLKLAAPEFDRIVVVRLDVVSGASSDDTAFTQAPFAQRLHAQLRASASVPKRFGVKLTHPLSRFAPVLARSSRLCVYFAVALVLI
jgi:hypothetical protein